MKKMKREKILGEFFVESVQVFGGKRDINGDHFERFFKVNDGEGSAP